MWLLFPLHLLTSLDRHHSWHPLNQSKRVTESLYSYDLCLDSFPFRIASFAWRRSINRPLMENVVKPISLCRLSLFLSASRAFICIYIGNKGILLV